jgi:hypothetical protein
MLVVQGDLAATAQKIQAHELVGINLGRWNQQVSVATELQPT